MSDTHFYKNDSCGNTHDWGEKVCRKCGKRRCQRTVTKQHRSNTKATKRTGKKYTYVTEQRQCRLPAVEGSDLCSGHLLSDARKKLGL